MLSVVITTWNEEKSLARAVSSVKSIADEIVVVDTESIDGTVALAKKLGCKVFTHKNTGIVEPVRNFSISKAKGDWILLLDADEEVPATLAHEIKRLLQDPTADYYRIARRSIIFGKWIKSSHWWPDYVYRFFKKGSVTWDDKIHSIPFTRGEGKDLSATEDMALIHHHYSTISQYVERLNRYTDFQALNLQAKGYNFSGSDVVAKPIAEFLNQYFARAGYREGMHGLALALLQAGSELVLYLKMWQTSGFIASEISPSALKSVLTQGGKDYHWWSEQARIDSASFLLKPFLKLKRKLGL